MCLRNTKEAYGSVAKSFHWLMFLLVAGLLVVGFFMTGMPGTPDKFKIYGLHKSTGILVLMLVVLRLGWKMASVSPLLPPTLKPWQKLAAKGTHALLYALLFAMPLSGWAMSSAAGFSVSWFGWVVLPDLVGPDEATRLQMRQLHGVFAWLLLGLITLHVAAALLHHFYYKDNVLRRMLPFSKEKKYADSDTLTGC